MLLFQNCFSNFARNLRRYKKMSKIRRALISVYNKDGLQPIINLLDREGVEIVSTGGTQRYIESLGVKCRPAEELTGFPSILGGRVKTLHPNIFGGILARRDNASDIEQMKLYNIDPIDLVIVDLYPFCDTVASGASEAEIIEKIDIGGISLIRATAKNFNDTVIVASKEQYAPLLEILQTKGAETTIEERRWFATEAFAVSSAYDSAIFNYFADANAQHLRIAADGALSLRYGENPHQKGVFFGDFDAMFEKLHGKEISYNNLLDIDAAVSLISDFSEPTFAILKHNNACGIASRKNLTEAWKVALSCDPVSAFGGIIITNGAVDKEIAEDINKIFFEAIVATDYTPEALEILETKKNRIILKAKQYFVPQRRLRSALNGYLEEDSDLKTETTADFTVVTKVQPTAEMINDMIFANKIVKHCKSNAIVLAKDGRLLASGIGQTSRVDALKQAITKAHEFGFDLQGATMASDAFFPFADCVEIAHQAGITSVIHPGGSIRDAESVEYCDNNGMAMVKTGYRHFKH
jgi:phosphoribosylaminoimidazolecarboxamide formyltransferase/IMP cyclohydrolase